MHRTWSDIEREFIKQNAHLFKDVELLEKLRLLTGKKIALQSLRKQRQKMGIFKECGRGRCKTYTKEDKVKNRPKLFDSNILVQKETKDLIV